MLHSPLRGYSFTAAEGVGFIRKSCHAALLVGLASTALGQGPPTLQGKLTLDQAVQAALKNSLDLRVSYAGLHGAESMMRSAQSKTLPRLSFNSFEFGGSDAGIVGSAGSDPGAIMSVPRAGFADQNLMLMAPLYTGGALANGVRSAKEGVGIATADAESAAADLLLQVKSAYFRVLGAREMVKAEELRVKSAEEMERVAKEQLASGSGIEASVQRTEAEAADAGQGLTTAKNEVEKSLIDLKLAMGVSLDSAIEVDDALSFTLPHGDLASAIESARSKRGEVRAAAGRIKQADLGVRSAKAASSPQLYGVAMADSYSSGSMGSSTGAAVGLTLSIPIFDGGSRDADRAQAQSELDKARTSAAKVSLEVERDVRTTWLDVESAAQNYTSAKAAVRSAQAAYDVICLRVQNGKAILVEELDSLQSLVREMVNAAQSLYNHELALAQLDRAEGVVPPGFRASGCQK